ncbi:MAG: PEP-CTERM sorting domain-containing protein [Planctomycetota bacterium]
MIGLLSSAASADVVTFNFPNDGTRDLTTDTFIQAGLTLTIDNPNGNLAFGNDTFGYILGGLFIDGGFAPNLDFTFSQDVRLLSYTVANDEFGGFFDMTQGATQSTGNDVELFGTFAFSNTADVFSGNSAISLTSSNNDGSGYGFSSITVERIPEPASASILAIGLGIACVRRRR